MSRNPEFPVDSASEMDATAVEILTRNMARGKPAWTVESIAARRASGDALVTSNGWSVSFDTSSETGKVARLSCVKYGPGMSLVVLERDLRDGEFFATTDEAECYALNAGRLQWYREHRASKAVSL